MVWIQPYNPAGSELLSTIAAAAPLVVLLGLLALTSVSAPRAAGFGLLTSLVVAIGVYGMPWKSAVAAAGFGACFGLFPIGWIVFAAVFLYVLTVESGEFEKVKASVAQLSSDHRLQALLIAFCFGAFLEGAAGFGTPVAISSAILIGVGFPPLYAAGLTLIANTAPVAFGALGTPIITLAKVSGLSEFKLSAMAGRQLPLFSLVIPAWMVCTMSGWKGLRDVWPAVVVCGGTFALVQFLVSNYIGPSLTDILGGITAMGALTALLCVWRPTVVWHFAGTHFDSDVLPKHSVMAKYSRREIVRAWVPWILLTGCVFLWGLPQFRTFLDGGKRPASTSSQGPSSALNWWERPNSLAGVSEQRWSVPFLDGLVQPNPDVAGSEAQPKAAEFRLNWLSATGTGIFIAAILSAGFMGIPLGRFGGAFLQTLRRLQSSLFTIAAMLAIAYVTQYSGSDVTLGLAFTRTGVLYPFFAALLGWIGVAITGSDTSSNALFGNLQRITAERLGLNPILICTANSTGGVMGKMIDAQSIVVSSAATGQVGSEGKILRFVLWHSVVLASLVGLLTLIQAYWIPQMVPLP